MLVQSRRIDVRASHHLHAYNSATLAFHHAGMQHTISIALAHSIAVVIE